MSNTTITPSVGAAALAGVAAAMGLALSPSQGGVALAGVPVQPFTVNQPSRTGLPVSWTNLGAGAAGAATPALPWIQARLNVSGTLGSLGSLVIEGSRDGGVTWTPLCGTSDPTRPGYRTYAGYGGLTIYADSPGLLILANTGAIDADFFPLLRPRVVGGDGTTAVNVVGNISQTGAVI